MMNTPDFVLVQAGENGSARRLEDGPIFLNPLFAEIFEATWVRMEHSSGSNPLHFNGALRSQIRPILRQYGFERPPRTLGELCGPFDYCDRLDAMTGLGLFAPELLARWQQLTFELSAQRAGTPHRTAIERYRRGDTVELLACHHKQDVLTKPGSDYRYLPGR